MQSQVTITSNSDKVWHQASRETPAGQVVPAEVVQHAMMTRATQHLGHSACFGVTKHTLTPQTSMACRRSWWRQTLRMVPSAGALCYDSCALAARLGSLWQLPCL